MSDCLECGKALTSEQKRRGRKRLRCARCSTVERNGKTLGKQWARLVGKSTRIKICSLANCNNVAPRENGRQRACCSDECARKKNKAIAATKSALSRVAVMCRNCGMIAIKTKNTIARSNQVFCDQQCANEYKKVSYTSPRWKEQHWYKYDNDPLGKQLEVDRQEFIDKALSKGWRCCAVCDKAFSGTARCCSIKCRKRIRAIRQNVRYKSESVDRSATCSHCGVQFSYTQHMSARTPRKFCSDRCSSRSSKNKKTHKQRAIRNGCEYDASVTLGKLIKKHGSKCYICGCECVKARGLNQDNEATLEHVIPMAIGGGHTWENCRVACRYCNTQKGTKLMDGKQLMLGLN